MNQDSTDLDLAYALRVLRRRGFVAILCMLLAGGAAFLVSKHQRKQYTTSASILYRSVLNDQQAAGLPPVGPTDPQAETDTNLKLATLPRIAAETAAKLGRGTTAADVSAAIGVTQQGDTQLATVAATASSPSLAAKLANAYAMQAIADRKRSDQGYYANALRAVNLQFNALTPALQGSAQGADLKNRASSLQVLKQLQSNNISLAQPAAVPSSPSSPLITRNTALGGVLGLLLGVGLVFALQRFDRRLRDLSEVEHAYGMPILAAVPDSASLKAGHAPEPLPPAEAETFSLLRARLRYFNVDRELHSLLITSAIPGEGKTTIALQLAISDAVSYGAQVALVEADLRRPSLAGRLGIDRGPGLAEVISRSVTLEDALQQVPLPGQLDNGNGATSVAPFSVLVAGMPPPNPSQLIESESMRHVLAMLTARFDLVIIDSPPVSVVSDAIPLVGQVSGVVVVSRIGKSSRDLGRHLREQLVKLDAPTLGVVANGLRTKRGDPYSYAYAYRAGNRADVKAADPKLDKGASHRTFEPTSSGIKFDSAGVMVDSNGLGVARHTEAESENEPK